MPPVTRVLVTTATRLKKILRAADTVARIGGDEFVVILQGLPQGGSLQDEARRICQKIFVELLAAGDHRQRPRPARAGELKRAASSFW